MKKGQNILKDELIHIARDISSLLDNAGSMPGMEDHSFSSWKNSLKSLEEKISEDIIRVAAVGSVKSGKSTFVNSFLKKDYLKRGAGVVTSIVTRVRGGKRLKAILFFKTWDEINADIQNALTLFPSKNGSFSEHFDLRRAEDRVDLEKALGSLRGKDLIEHGSRNGKSVLLASYLQGYKKVEEIISNETTIKEWEDDLFVRHREFVGYDSLAVYLKDIQIEVGKQTLESHLEIADCQGSDSPNPLHLAMIQDYLVLAHLTIYIISSRTGLREADIRFLSIIKKLGIIDNTLFIINFDFSEHESLENLKEVISKIKDDLSLVVSDYEVYSFSSLFNLFRENDQNLTKKDRLRLEQWTTDKELVEFSDRSTKDFNDSLNQKLEKERYALLLKNHLERLGVLSGGVSHWINLNLDVLKNDSKKANLLIDKVSHHNEKIRQFEVTMKSTFKGATEKIKKEVHRDIDSFFDPFSGALLSDLIQFIKTYNVSLLNYEDKLETTGFATSLHQVFEEFKEALDSFMAETVNPEVIKFIRKEEQKIVDNLTAIFGPYYTMASDAILKYNQGMENLDLPIIDGDFKKTPPFDLDPIKRDARLTLPSAATMMRYSPKIKAQATLYFGIYSLVKRFKNLFKKESQKSNENTIKGLKDGIASIKKESEKSILSIFKDYRENIKFQYASILADLISESLQQRLIDKFQTSVSDLSKISQIIGSSQSDKDRAIEIMRTVRTSLKSIEKRIDEFREKIAFS